MSAPVTPMGDRSRPRVLATRSNWPGAVLDFGQDSEMAEAYLAWMESGQAHDAFGAWYDSQPAKVLAGFRTAAGQNGRRHGH